MNRSFSKIRHIQEVNKLVEQRLLSENKIVNEQANASTVYRELDAASSDEAKIVIELLKINTFDELIKFGEEFSKLSKVPFGRKLAGTINSSDDPSETKQIQDHFKQKGIISSMKRGKGGSLEWEFWDNYQFKNFPCVAKQGGKSYWDDARSKGGIKQFYFLIGNNKYYSTGQYIDKNGEVFDYSCGKDGQIVTGTTGGSFGTDKKITDKSLGVGNKISQELQSGAKSRPGDPYQYKIGSDNQWYFKSYLNRGKQVADWKLVTNADSIKTLDTEFPGRSTGVTTNQPSQPDVNNITIAQIQQFVKDNPEFADPSINIDTIKNAMVSKGLA